MSFAMRSGVEIKLTATNDGSFVCGEDCAWNL